MDPQTSRETAPSKPAVERLYLRLFGPPALDAEDADTDEQDEADAYAIVYEIARKYPAVARQAARDATAAHYRGEAPFRYDIDLEDR